MMRRARIGRGALVLLASAWMLASPASVMPVRAQSAFWAFQLEWNHTGKLANYHQLCVDDLVPCRVLSDAQNAEGDVWRAALPVLPPGEHRLVLQACNFQGCVAGVPDLMIRVSAPSPEGPPIEIIEHPPEPVRR